MRLWVSSVSYSGSFSSRTVQNVSDLLRPPRRDVEREAADAREVVGQARAAVLLEQVEHQLPLAQAVEEHRPRADVHGVAAEPDQVARDALQLSQRCPDVLRAARHLDRHQLLDRLDVADVVGGRRHVVHPVGQQDDLRVVAVLAQLLDAPVQVADPHVGVDHLLAVELQHDPQHAVGGRVLRPHVDDQLVGVEQRRGTVGVQCHILFPGDPDP